MTVNPQIFQVPVMVSKISSMSKSLRIVTDTLDNLSGDAMSRLFAYVDKPAWLTLNVHQIEATDIIDLPEIHYSKKEKSHSVRLRECLFRLWQQKSLNYDDFEEYYKFYMTHLIEKIKEQLT